jgi:hypothetical protein
VEALLKLCSFATLFADHTTTDTPPVNLLWNPRSISPKPSKILLTLRLGSSEKSLGQKGSVPGKGQNGKRAIADAAEGCVPVSPCVHSAASWNSHKDQMVWGGLRFDETPLSDMEDAFPELRDNE